ncbi:hypothetical protein G6F57_023286 [Rhizopus arrhizus]|nr:hypothetical protein G6F57_023286 [Rhizopus arrhizus]
MILAITLRASLRALAYVMVTPSVYSADIIVQVEEEMPNGQARSLLGDVSAMFDTKAETSGEMEVLPALFPRGGRMAGAALRSAAVSVQPAARRVCMGRGVHRNLATGRAQ